MISVDNSAEKRVFSNSDKKDVLNLKQKVIKKIEEIETRTKNYNDLAIFETEKYSDNISVFKFKKLIDKQITNLLESKLTDTFKDELRVLKNDLYLLLIADIDTIKNYLKSKVSSTSLLIHQGDKKLKSSDFKKYQKKFEDLYEKQLSGNEKLKKQFFNLFENINVCPYCNRNFVNPIYKRNRVGNDNGKWSPDIEHFFPKSIYPFLSLSISNLLPSCAFCNKIKSDVDTFKHNCLSPYEIKNSDFRFDFSLDTNQVKKVKLISKTDSKNSEILHLESLYNEVHSKYINDIFENDLKYTQKNKDFLNTFKILTEDDYKKVFRNYYKEEDFNKHPLSKMTKDLYNQISNLKSK